MDRAAVVNEIWEHRGNLKVVRNLTATFLIVLMLEYSFCLIRLRLDYKPENSMLAVGIVHDPSLRDE